MPQLYVSATSDTIRTKRIACGGRHVSAHVRGWDSGIEVDAILANDGASILYTAVLTQGSHEKKSDLRGALFSIRVATEKHATANGGDILDNSLGAILA